MIEKKLLILEDIPSLEYEKDLRLLSLAVTLSSKGELSSLKEPTSFSFSQDLNPEKFDIVVFDLEAQRELAAIKWLRKKKVVVIVLVREGDFTLGFKALEEGACEFLFKPLTLPQLKLTLLQHASPLEETIPKDRERAMTMIGVSEPMQTLYYQMTKAASTSDHVLISGETGSGKELIAQTIHRASKHRGSPFIAVNCSAIPSDLLESQFFGHAKGAFTGALRDFHGFAKQAEKGTLFLDEICDMSLELQSKLLRFIDDKIIQPVGSETRTKIDLRLICATNQDVEGAVDAGKFRKDLYFRLNVIPVLAPPLQVRGQDILTLAYYFLSVFSRRRKKEFVHLDDEICRRFLGYAWPGNVRELKTIISYLVLFNQGHTLTAEMLFSSYHGKKFLTKDK